MLQYRILSIVANERASERERDANKVIQLLWVVMKTIYDDDDDDQRTVISGSNR